MPRCKILHGNKRHCIKRYDEEKAKRLEKEGRVEILDDLEYETADIQQDGQREVETCRGETSDGSPCGRVVTEGDFCFQHEPEDE